MNTQPRETSCIYLYNGEEPKSRPICLDCQCNPRNNSDPRKLCPNIIDSNGLIDAQYKIGMDVVPRKKAILGCESFSKDNHNH